MSHYCTGNMPLLLECSEMGRRKLHNVKTTQGFWGNGPQSSHIYLHSPALCHRKLLYNLFTQTLGWDKEKLTRPFSREKIIGSNVRQSNRRGKALPIRCAIVAYRVDRSEVSSSDLKYININRDLIAHAAELYIQRYNSAVPHGNIRITNNNIEWDTAEASPTCNHITDMHYCQ